MRRFELVIAILFASCAMPLALGQEPAPLDVQIGALSNSIQEQLKPGETRNLSILLTNPTANPVVVNVSIPGDLDSLLTFEGGKSGRTSLRIEPNTAIAQLLFITAKSTHAPQRTYLGDILVTSGGSVLRRIPVTIVVRAEREAGILDVKVNVLSGFIKEGQPIRFIVGLINLGTAQRFDVNLSYTVKDENDNIVVRKPDTRAIETTLSFVEKINLPNDTKSGGHVIQVDASYNGFTASSIDTFAIVKGVPLGEFVFDWTAVLLMAFLVIPTIVSIVLAVVVFRLVRARK